MDEMEKMVKYFLDGRMDGCMDGWMGGRMDWRELSQCIQEQGLASAFELKPPMLAVFLFQRVPELILEPCRRALSGVVNGSSNCSQDSVAKNITSLLISWLSQVPLHFLFKCLIHSHILTQPCAGATTGQAVETWYRSCKICNMDTYYWGYGCRNKNCAPWIADWYVFWEGWRLRHELFSFYSVKETCPWLSWGSLRRLEASAVCLQETENCQVSSCKYCCSGTNPCWQWWGLGWWKKQF